jgi:hypothetical protein
VHTLLAGALLHTHGTQPQHQTLYAAYVTALQMRVTAPHLLLVCSLRNLGLASTAGACPLSQSGPAGKQPR